MTKQQEKQICLTLLEKHGEKIIPDYLNRYILKFPHANVSTVKNVRYGTTYNLEVLKNIFQVSKIKIGNAIPSLASKVAA